MKKCFFLGDRLVFAKVKSALEESVELHIRDYGVEEFVVGNYGAFNRMVARVVIAAKERHPDITLTLLYPYRCIGKSITALSKFDAVFFPATARGFSRKAAIIEASRYAICSADYIIAATRHSTKTINGLLRYALWEKKQITYLK